MVKQEHIIGEIELPENINTKEEVHDWIIHLDPSYLHDVIPVNLHHCYEIDKIKTLLLFHFQDFNKQFKTHDEKIEVIEYLIMDLQLLADELEEENNDIQVLSTHFAKALEKIYPVKVITNGTEEQIKESEKELFNQYKFDVDFVLDIDLYDNWEFFFSGSLSREEKQKKFEEYSFLTSLNKEERKNVLKSIALDVNN